MTHNLFTHIDRDTALEQVAANAERHSPRFAERAEACMIDHLRCNGPQTGEALSDACKALGIIPHDDRAFGPVLMRLAKAKLIHKIGIAPRRKGHGCSGGNIWELTQAAKGIP